MTTATSIARPASPVALTRISWTPRRELDATDWLRQGRWLGSLGRAVGWWIGDWLRYGNARYGERYAAAERITGYDRQTLMNMVYVASRVEAPRRRELLSFSHHAEVAALPAPEQERWLERAERDGFSVRVLRREVQRDHRHERAAGAQPAPAEATCPGCGRRFSLGSG
jgi:signal transduction histidine kinase